MIQQFHFCDFIWRDLNTDSKEYKHAYVHCNIIYISQDLEAAQLSIGRWVDKTTVVHLHNGILLGHKKEENFTLLTAWMDLKSIMLCEIRQSEKTNTTWFYSYVESNEQTELTSKQTYRQRAGWQLWGWGWGWIELKRKRTHGPGHHCCDCSGEGGAWRWKKVKGR